MDVVYPLKRNAGRYNELRYSLRSLGNLPHNRVFLVGGRPDWARGVEHIETGSLSTKYKDATKNILAACLDERVSDPFILFNDDFFITEAVDQIPVLNRGRVSEVEKEFIEKRISGPYLDGMRNTLAGLEKLGYENPLSFELHVPMVTHKQMRRKAIELGSELPVWHARTAYGALAGMVGETVRDVKAINSTDPLPTHLPFVSTSDRSFAYGKAGKELRKMFREPSSHEGC